MGESTLKKNEDEEEEEESKSKWLQTRSERATCSFFLLANI